MKNTYASEQLMIKRFFFFLLINYSFFCAQEKNLNIKPSPENPILLKIAKSACIDQAIIDTYAQFIIDPTKIIKITKIPCLSSNIENYQATLLDKSIVDCTYFPHYERTVEIWASRTLVHDRIKFRLPIDQNNFFILKDQHEKQSILNQN